MIERNTMISAAADTWVSEPLLREYLSMSSSTIRRLRKRGLPLSGERPTEALPPRNSAAVVS